MIRAGLLGLVLACAGPPGRSADQPWIAFPVSVLQPPAPNDPFPIRRVFLPPNRMPGDLGTYVRLPRDEFERRVRAASEAVRNPPRIAAAQYAASFADGALTGTAEWTIRNPGGKNGLLTLDPHRLALARPRSADGTAIRLIRSATDDEAPRTFAWLDGASAADGSRLLADWSLRASGDPGDSRFELRVPPAGIAFLTLTLPAELVPRVSAEDAVVSGPLPADNAARQRWRIAFGGRSALDLTLIPHERSRTARPGPVRTTARWSVGEDRAEGTFRFDLDPAHEPGDAYGLELDDRLIVQSVSSDVPIDWRAEPARPGTPATIRVVPRETGRMGRILVTAALRPPEPGRSWAVPAVRLRDAVPSESTIHVRIDATIRPVQLDSGDYRLMESDQTDATRTLAWTSTLAKNESRDRKLPALTFALPNAEIVVSERATFAVGRSDCFLRVTATVTAVRGPVSQLSIHVPESYQTAVAPTVSNDSLATARLDDSKPTRWSLSLSRPLASGQSTTVTFSLAAPLPAVRDGVIRVGVPAATWPSSNRSGTIAVTTSPEWATVSPLVVAYQDLPPSGELFLRRAEIGSPNSSHPSAGKPADAVGDAIVDLRPDHGEARIGDRTIAYVVTGTTASAGNRSRVRLPAGATVRAVRVGGKVIDRPQIESDQLLLPAGTSPELPFEIEFERIRSGSFAERIQLAWPDGLPLPVRWMGNANWLAATWEASGETVAVRRDVIDGMGWLLAACLLVPFARTIAAGPSVCTARNILFGAAVVCGSFVAGGVAGSAFVAPLVVSLAGLGFMLLRNVPSATVAVILLGVPAGAAAPRPVEVYLMYGTGEDADTLFVYAPKAVLVRLDRLAGTTEPEAAILSARYFGAERQDEVTIRADWIVSVPPGEPHRLKVPLSGAKLENVSLDGKPAFPEPLPAGGFSLAMSNRGLHTVSATFAVPVRIQAGERELRFSGPDVVLNAIEFTAMTPATRIDVTSRRGRQIASVRDGKAVAMAELGEGRNVAVRWQDREPKPGPAATESTLEAAVWDVDESEAILTAAIQFPANHGPPFRIHVPSGFSLVRATARPADGGPPMPVATNQTDETLIVTPRQAADGKMTVVLVLVPDRPLSAQPRFAFPRSADRPDPSAVYAIRLNGLQATEFGREGAIDIPADAATRATTVFPELSLDARPATRAYRRHADAVSISPRLINPSANSHWTGTAMWTLGTRADVHADWQCSGPLPGLASFALPSGVTLASVRGPDLIDTTMIGGTGTLWLRTGDDPGPIRLVATMAIPASGDCLLPVIRPPHAEKAIVRLRPATGFAIRVPPADGVTPLADGSYELAAGVDSVRVAVSAADPPKSMLPAEAPPTATPAPPAAVTSPTTPTPAEAPRSPRSGILIWLGGMVVLGLAFVPSLRVVKPELLTGWGVLAWISWSPLAAVAIAIGIVMRVARTLHETPSPAR